MAKITYFHEHPDGLVIVHTDAGAYIDTRANFEADFGQLAPLPAGADERIYEPNRRHAFHGDGNVIDGGPRPWDFGDRAIAAFVGLMAKKKARDEAETKKRTEEFLRQAQAAR